MNTYRNTVLLLVTLVAILVLTDAKPKKREGVCFKRYSAKSGCRKFIQTNGLKYGTIEECCRGGGVGWSKKKKNRRKCISCDTVNTSFWADWGRWSDCSATCGIGSMTRERRCISTGKSAKCRGQNVQKQRCKKPHCPVDGGWTQWSPWTSCSKTCGKGSKIQRRACADPKPKYGGKECQGKLENWAECEMQKMCPIDGGWGEWSAWSECSQTCDMGTKTRNRICDTPPPKYGGKPCPLKDAIGLDYCREERCNPRISPCDDNSEECASGSGSKWQMSGSGSGSNSGSGFSSGFGESGAGSGDGSDGAGSGRRFLGKNRKPRKRRRRISDDEDFS